MSVIGVDAKPFWRYILLEKRLKKCLEIKLEYFTTLVSKSTVKNQGIHQHQALIVNMHVILTMNAWLVENLSVTTIYGFSIWKTCTVRVEALELFSYDRIRISALQSALGTTYNQQFSWVRIAPLSPRPHLCSVDKLHNWFKDSK